LHPKYCIFLTNVDGLFGDVEKADLIHEVTLDQLDNMVSKSEVQLQVTNTPDSNFDVTGGMKRKVSESIPIVRSGTNVHFINGFKPERVLDLVNNEKCLGTCFKKDQSQI
jgi:isopentenyl phosphate kinase